MIRKSRSIFFLFLTFAAGASVLAENCPEHLGKLYARGIREFWAGTAKDFGDTVYGPLLDLGFDHESVMKLEDVVIDNYEKHWPTGDAESLGRALRISPQNAQVLLSFYDLESAVGQDSLTTYSAYNEAKRHLRAKRFLPVTLYFKANQTRKDIVQMTEELRRELKKPALTQHQVYELMWITNHEMSRAWNQPVPDDTLAPLRQKLGEKNLPSTLSDLAVYLYQNKKWSKSDIAQALNISETSFTHHLKAIGIESNAVPWSDTERQQLRAAYGAISINELAEMLGRTESSIRGEAKLLGLTDDVTRDKTDLHLTPEGALIETASKETTALKHNGEFQADALRDYLTREYLAGKDNTEIAQALKTTPQTLAKWNIKLGIYPHSAAGTAPKDFDLKEYLGSKPKPGHAIFEAFLAAGQKLPARNKGRVKGDPGGKLNKALSNRKSADSLVAEIPEELRARHPEAIDAFRKAYQARLDTPLQDRSKTQGHAIFEAFLAGEQTLPARNKGRVKGDPGGKLSKALSNRKSADSLVAEIPEELRARHPEAIDAFRKAYQARLDTPLRAKSKTPGHAIFEAFLAAGQKLPAQNKGTWKGEAMKLSNALRYKKSADSLLAEIPEELKNQHPDAVEAFRQAYQARLDTPLRAKSKTPGHAIFEVFLAAGQKLPAQNKGTWKGEAMKLSNALRNKKSADSLVAEIPEDIKEQHPEAVEAFRQAYQARLDTPLRDRSKTQGHAIFEAFLAAGQKLPAQKKGTWKGEAMKLSKALTIKKSADSLLAEIPEELKNQHPDAVEAFRQAYQARLDTPIMDRSKTQGHAIFEAFLAADQRLPGQKREKGDPGRKLSSALQVKKSPDSLIAEIPEELKNQHPDAVEAFRKAYQSRLDALSSEN